ncbi:Gfo/Idh/MocA family protein [Halodurantibacterium flavum]|uniref:Gfo/Idh/MocA family protein n=1 Tax=Halodurantibacterium flavum TaxID=1382802 RepID=A0ABW4RZX8_9RHOB
MKISIIGLGMALAPHMASINDLLGRVTLAHAVARSAERRDAFEAEYRRAASDDLNTAISDPAVDAVILLTPPDSHRELGTRILQGGKHLIIEKPAGLTTDDTRALAALAKDKGLLVAPVLQHRFRPSVRAAAQLVGSGELGMLCGATCLIPWWRSQSYYDEPGRGSFARDGGGVLLTQAIHTLDVLRALSGGMRIKAAQVATTALHRMEGEDVVCALAEFGPGAAPGTIMATTAGYPGFPETMTLIFEHATLRLGEAKMQAFYHDGRVNEVRDAGGGGNADPMAFHHTDHTTLLSAFCDAVEGRAALQVDLTDVVRTRELIDQILAFGNTELQG